MLNLTDFSWTLEPHGPAGLELRIYTAPRMARPLRGVLPRTWRPIIRTERCVRIRRGSAILAFFRALGQQPHLEAAVRAYVATYRGRGSRTFPLRVAAVKQVMRILCEGPDGTQQNGLADTTECVPSVCAQTPLPGGGADVHGTAPSGAGTGADTGSAGVGQA